MNKKKPHQTLLHGRSSKETLSLMSKLHFEAASSVEHHTLNQYYRNVIDRIELTMQMITIHALSKR